MHDSFATKAAWRLNQVVWLIIGVIEIGLGLRFALRLLGANLIGFANIILRITEPFVQPFRGIFASTVNGASVWEWFTLLAMIVYWLVGWIVAYLLELALPVPPTTNQSVVS